MTKFCMDDEDDFGLRQLFDEKYIGHLSVDEQLRYYKRRNLTQSKTYVTGLQVWGEHQIGERTRVVNFESCTDSSTANENIKYTQKPLEDEFFDVPSKDSSQFYIARNKKPVVAPAHQKLGAVKLTEAQIEAFKEVEEKEAKKNEYQKWIAERMYTRKCLNDMDDIKKYCSTKQNLTPLELLVLQRFIEWKYPKPSSSADSHSEAPIKQGRRIKPLIDRPVPVAISVIEAYIQEHRMRLIDFFTMSDHDKDWQLSRDELLNTIKSTGIPISSSELDDFLQFLDSSCSGTLSYKNIASMRVRFLREERKKLIAEYGKADELVKKEKLKAAQAEKEKQRLKELLNRPINQNEGSFVTYAGDPKLYTAKIVDPRKQKENENNVNSAGKPLSERNCPIKKRPATVPVVNTKSKKEVKISTANTYPLGDKSSSTADVVNKPIRHRSAIQSARLSDLGGVRTESIESSHTPSKPNSKQKSTKTESESQTAVPTISQSRSSSATTFLQTPEINTNECIDLEQELFFDKCKRHRFQKRRVKEHIRSKTGPSEMKPKMILSGAENVDKHLKFSSIWEPEDTHDKIQKYRQKTWEEYERCVLLCKYRGVDISEKVLARALLHSGDIPTEKAKRNCKRPGKLFKATEVPHTKSQLRAILPIGAMDTDDEFDSDLEELVAKTLEERLGHKPEQGSETDSDLDSIDYKIYPLKADQVCNPAYIYPRHKPPRMKPETVNLVTGDAKVGNKVDCWFTYKDFVEANKNVTKKYKPYKGFVNKHAFWTNKENKQRPYLHKENRKTREASCHFQNKKEEKIQYAHKTTIFSNLSGAAKA